MVCVRRLAEARLQLAARGVELALQPDGALTSRGDMSPMPKTSPPRCRGFRPHAIMNTYTAHCGD